MRSLYSLSDELLRPRTSSLGYATSLSTLSSPCVKRPVELQGERGLCPSADASNQRSRVQAVREFAPPSRDQRNVQRDRLRRNSLIHEPPVSSVIRPSPAQLFALATGRPSPSAEQRAQNTLSSSAATGQRKRKIGAALPAGFPAVVYGRLVQHTGIAVLRERERHGKFIRRIARQRRENNSSPPMEKAMLSGVSVTVMPWRAGSSAASSAGRFLSVSTTISSSIKLAQQRRRNKSAPICISR